MMPCISSPTLTYPLSGTVWKWIVGKWSEREDGIVHILLAKIADSQLFTKAVKPQVVSHYFGSL